MSLVPIAFFGWIEQREGQQNDQRWHNEDQINVQPIINSERATYKKEFIVLLKFKMVKLNKGSNCMMPDPTSQNDQTRSLETEQIKIQLTMDPN